MFTFFDNLLQAQTAYEHMKTLMAVVMSVSVAAAVVLAVIDLNIFSTVCLETFNGALLALFIHQSNNANFGLHIAVASVFVSLFSLLDISFFVLMGFILQDFTKDRAGYVALVILLHVLAATSLFKHPTHLPEFLHVMIFMFGSVGLVVVNSLVLVVELFLKSGKGARTVEDLRVIVLPFETAFVLAWLALQIYSAWMRLQVRKKKFLKKGESQHLRKWRLFLSDVSEKINKL
ncbi:uncharacterized protein LOC132846925 isoform X2 [Tachysurus vachellii]|uniref:uncharacterized protein LOC132846925 isoform X2 n=1 Tax=Tachysurus vachellii TaxID=175792 RepID=UPI00296A9731|nr:uncharacterized protein LOC132846925 isoform X2 [Tachysurus vachellii]